MTGCSPLSSLIFQAINHIRIRIQNSYFNSYTAIQAVSCAAQSWIVGTYGHLHLV